MMRVPPLVWVSCGLVSLTISVLMAGEWLVDLVPTHDRQVFEYRRDLAESLAVQYSALAERNQIETVKFAMEMLAKRNPDILSLALLQTSGTVVAQVGAHARVWVQPPGEESTLEFLQVPIFSGDQRWGWLQVAFRQANVSGLQWFLTDPWVRFLVFVGVAGFGGYFFFMKRTLRQLDPSGIIPTRVKTALDALTQGVVMIDTRDCIVLANEAFCQAVGKPVTSLIGSDLSTLSWTAGASSATVLVHPWTAAIMGGQPQAAGTALFLSLPDGGSRKLIVNTVPIRDDGSTVRGALVSFYDVTELERASSQLREANSELKSSCAQMLEKDQEIEEAHTSLLAEMNKRKKAEDEKEELYQQLAQLVRQANRGKGEAAA